VNGQYQTAGSIEDGPEGVREHWFIRADAYPSREDAASRSRRPADHRSAGDRIFNER
jgi:hypothetical protein